MSPVFTNIIERLQQDFVCGKGEEGKKSHLLKWNKIVNLKEREALGLDL